MLARMLGAATFNRGTFEEVEHDTGATWQAALVVVFVSLSGAIGGALSGNTGLVSGIIVGIVGGVVWWALWAAGCWLVGTKILNTPETRADWGELARGTGFAQTPGLLSVLVFLPYAGGAIAAVIFVWRFVTMLMAVQESLDYNSMWRAFFVVLIALIPVLIVAAIIFAILGSLGIQDSETSTSALLGIFNVIGA